MDVDMESVEIVFAQKLACGEPTTRQRALRTLHDWIQQQSQTNPFTEADMMRLCKGLHYVLWMQDKMLLQEELADRISGLLSIFSHVEEKVLYIRCLFKSLSKEWHAIDRWRMDKFLMLMRRVLRVLFGYLAGLGWKKEIRSQFWQAFEATTISADASFSQGLKFHFASIFLDELDTAGGLTKKQVTSCLKPFADLLGVRAISKYLFDSILDEIFLTILHQRSEEVVQMEETGEPMDDSQGIKFDYKSLGKMLFDIGKRPEVPSERRNKLYDAVKRFEVAAAGGDPFHFEAPQPKEQLRRADFEEAERKLLELEEQIKIERLQRKKEKRELKSAKSKVISAPSKEVEKSSEVPKVGKGKVKKTKKADLKKSTPMKKKTVKKVKK